MSKTPKKPGFERDEHPELFDLMVRYLRAEYRSVSEARYLSDLRREYPRGVALKTIYKGIGCPFDRHEDAFSKE